MGPDHLDQCYYRYDLVLRMGNGIGMWRGKGLGWAGVGWLRETTTEDMNAVW